jgi:hypothetical protein
MNPCHTWRLYCSSLKILVELKNFQNKLPHPCKKGILAKMKSTSQKEVNNRIHIACSDLYCNSFSNVDSPENVPQHRQTPLEVKLQLNPTVRFDVMLNSVKLNGRKFYAKIWIWPYLIRITRLNRIIPSLFKKIRPLILNRISSDFISLLFKPSEFSYC